MSVEELFQQPVRPADVQRLRKRYAEALEREKERLAGEWQREKERLAGEWQRGEVSNFGYLQSLNHLSGRSLEDLSQYPVFPWVLRHLRHPEPPSAVVARGDSAELAEYFRDLSRTLGDLGDPERRKILIEKYILAGEMEERPYHYGTHYSTPAFAMHFLLRLEPFTALGRALQGGRYDVPDRIFSSLPESWRSCLTETSDVRELTPELFSLPECLLNLGGLDLGVRQDGSRVDHVELPPWASDAYHFIHEHRLALESPPVSASLHRWVDLIWGHKQTGEAATEALNVFYPLTYEDTVDWAAVEPCLRHSREQQVLHFGQTPPQLFAQPHGAREAAALVPSLLRPAAARRPAGDGGEPPPPGVACWHSSALTATLGAPRSRGLGLGFRPSGAPGAEWRGGSALAPVVAVGSHRAAGELERLFVVQADGTLWCYRVRRPQSLEQGASMSLGMALSLATSPAATAPALPVNRPSTRQPELDLEAKFQLPGLEDGGGLQERLLTDPAFARQACAWAFLPARRFFARGGFSNGSVLFGSASQQHAHHLPHAHLATVSAVALSQEIAGRVRGARGCLLMTGARDGTVAIWTAADEQWQSFKRLVTWQVHLAGVRCVDFGEHLGLALSCAEDGLVNVYDLRPPMRPRYTFAFEGRAPVLEARFAARAPASVVARCGGTPGAPGGQLCVWAMHGFRLAALSPASALLGMRVVSEGGAGEALLCASGDGHVELLSLPYLHAVWRVSCQWSLRSTALDTLPGRSFAWLGHEDGSFGAVYAKSRAEVEAEGRRPA